MHCSPAPGRKTAIAPSANPRKHPTFDHHHGHEVGERLYLHRHTVVHRLPPHVKIVAAFAFVVVVVATPIQNRWAFVGYFALVLVATRVAQIPARTVALRATVEVPFLLFAVLMPFFGSGERVVVGPLSLARDGLEAGAGIVAKGTLGVLTAIVLSSSTQARELLRGFERLRMPQLMVQIVSFMLR